MSQVSFNEIIVVSGWNFNSWNKIRDFDLVLSLTDRLIKRCRIVSDTARSFVVFPFRFPIGSATRGYATRKT